MDKPEEVWISKYATTRGVFKTYSKEKPLYPPRPRHKLTEDGWISPGQWHTTEEAAIGKALQIIGRCRKETAKKLAEMTVIESELMRKISTIQEIQRRRGQSYG